MSSVSNAPIRGSWWSRRSKGSKLTLITVILLALAGTALALFFVFRGVSGSVSGAVYQLTLTSYADPGDNPVNCVITAPGAPGGDLDIQWTGVVPGEECQFTGTYDADIGNTGDLLLQDFIAPAGLDIAFTSFSAADSCGTTWSPGNSKVAGVTATFNGTVSSIVFDENIHGFEWVRPVDFNAAECDGLPSTP